MIEFNSKEFLEIYNKVFDENNNVKLCGRNECKNLIKYCNGVAGVKNCYGDEDTGIMKVDKIKSFRIVYEG